MPIDRLHHGDGDVPALVASASAVLDENWDGASTRPAPRLYPHQWSWDSAFIAIGQANRRPSRATTELISLFDAQWSNGLVPHIVFSEGDGDYYPSPTLWKSRTCPEAPRHVETSGICQPAVHALAVERVVAALDEAGNEVHATEFARQMFEPLCAWHDYLFDARRPTGANLVEIWHPWESGMDNSPLWDGALAAMDASMATSPGDIPAYERVDLAVSGAGARPTDQDYDRYTFIVSRLLADGYSPGVSGPGASQQGRLSEIDGLPFRMHDVLFNSVLARSERSLAVLAGRVGADPTLHAERGAALAAAIHAEMWSGDDGMHLAFDVKANRSVPVRAGGSFAALLADPPPRIAAVLIETLTEHFRCPVSSADADGFVVPTIAPSDPLFDAARYWRGPAWVNVMWLVALGLAEVGRRDLANEVRRGIVSCASVVAQGDDGPTGAMFEYFDPLTMHGHGSDNFSWTAALALETIDALGDETGLRDR